MESVKLLEDILSEKQVKHILDQTKPGSHLIGYDLKPATQGLAGFLGDHFRLILNVRDGNIVKSINLFIKLLPMVNKPKSEFIDQNNYFRRESLMFKLFDEMPGNEGPNPWRTIAYIHSENILVMPDLAAEGYKAHPVQKSFDKTHVLVTISSLARFHAACASYIAKKSLENPYNLLDEYGHIMAEPTFKESPWLRAGAKLTNNFLKHFSTKWNECPKNLLEQLDKLYLIGCDSLKDYEGTLNVIIHKDLWANNILFKYPGDAPINAVLIDFQCIWYGPPAFDVMVFLYLTTSRKFRASHENEILDHYYTVFSENVAEETKLEDYNREVFFHWCEKARLFGIIGTALICPYVMMDPIAAQNYFDNPDTYMDYLEVDRSYPVIEYAKENSAYRNKLLEIYEELVEKYILGRAVGN